MSKPIVEYKDVYDVDGAVTIECYNDLSNYDFIIQVTPGDKVTDIAEYMSDIKQLAQQGIDEYEDDPERYISPLDRVMQLLAKKHITAECFIKAQNPYPSIYSIM